jgi:hypothetical protein
LNNPSALLPQHRLIGACLKQAALYNTSYLPACLPLLLAHWYSYCKVRLLFLAWRECFGASDVPQQTAKANNSKNSHCFLVSTDRQPYPTKLLVEVVLLLKRGLPEPSINIKSVQRTHHGIARCERQLNSAPERLFRNCKHPIVNATRIITKCPHVDLDVSTHLPKIISPTRQQIMKLSVRIPYQTTISRALKWP